MDATRPVVIEYRSGLGVAGARRAERLPSPPPPSRGLSVADAQSRVPWHLYELNDPGARLVDCTFWPSLELKPAPPDSPVRGSVHLDYLLDDGQLLSLNQHRDDDTGGPLRYFVKPGASRWKVERVDGSEFAVLRTEDRRRFASVNWKALDGVILRLEPRDMVVGLDGSLLNRILGHVQQTGQR